MYGQSTACGATLAPMLLRQVQFVWARDTETGAPYGFPVSEMLYTVASGVQLRSCSGRMCPTRRREQQKKKVSSSTDWLLMEMVSVLNVADPHVLCWSPKRRAACV